ncbi:protein takeout-like isoform X1 [Periplaneta americana]|uniref:protein takeout-like isoform X1 n=1 Tax=Periplaneta americana TaxID=6978 RepID=UPI0037E7CD08
MRNNFLNSSRVLSSHGQEKDKQFISYKCRQRLGAGGCSVQYYTTMRLILLAVTLCLAHGKIIQLPSYFKVCARSDPNFNECALKNGREIIPHLVKGEKTFNLPPLDPFEVKVMNLSEGQGEGQLNLTMRDVKLHGLRHAYLQNYSTDFDKGHKSMLLTVPQLKVLATYNASGHILLVPIRGTGNINITLVDTKCMVRYHFMKQKINGVDQGQIIATTVHLDPKRMYIHLDNLFNGDKGLGNQMNKLLDENWKEVFDEITPHIAGSFIEMFRGLANGFAKSIPYDLLFPETLS